MDYPGKVITKTQVTPTQTSASGNWTLDDQAAAIKNNNWPVALVPNPISKSLRFNNLDSAYLSRTQVSGNRRTWTYSFWTKLAVAGYSTFCDAGPTPNSNFHTQFYMSSSGNLTLYFYPGSTSALLVTTQVFRDVGAWYHIVLAVDTTQATASNRIKVYVNGTQITSFSTATYPSQNFDTYVNDSSSFQWMGQYIGGGYGTGTAMNGYITEYYLIDGQALTPSSFGMTNPQTGQWIPIKYSGTYGSNGCYVNFKDATSTTTLGYDYSGNANNWTTNNFSVTAGVGNDSLTDVPTPWFAYNTTGDVGGVVRGNYCTLNPLDNAQGATFSNGNLQAANATGTDKFYRGTFGMPSGKWYWEIQLTTVGNRNRLGITDTGLVYNAVGLTGNYALVSVGNQSSNTSGTLSGSIPTFADGDYITFALDEDTGILYFEKNAAPNTSTSPKFTGLSTTTTYFVTNQEPGGTPGVNIFNFGQRPFAYTPPTGFRSLCTTNLPATAIGFGLTNQGDDYFNTVLYTGTGATQNITGLDFQPDWVWIKIRNQAYSHNEYDSVRGANKRLRPNQTGAEATVTDQLMSFNSNGFTLGADSGEEVNSNGNTFVAWNWKAGGTGVSNTAGTITSTVSANTTAGFSIVTYTGTGTNGATVGHGLGVTPSMMIFKKRNTTGNWIVVPGNSSLFGGSYYLQLNTTSGIISNSNMYTSYPGTSLFYLSTNTDINNNNDTYVAYCFAAVPGYSAFGSYTGNGSTDGPFIYTGFRPRWVMYKRTDSAGSSWVIIDTARDTYNYADKELYPNLSNSENTGSARIDVLSNGYKIRSDSTYGYINASGGTYIYAAFAEFPFQFANAR